MADESTAQRRLYMYNAGEQNPLAAGDRPITSHRSLISAFHQVSELGTGIVSNDFEAELKNHLHI